MASSSNGPVAARMTSSSPIDQGDRTAGEGDDPVQPVERGPKDRIELPLAGGRGRDLEHELGGRQRPLAGRDRCRRSAFPRSKDDSVSRIVRC